MNFRSGMLVMGLAAMSAMASASNWTAKITVDNAYNLYTGNNTGINLVGGDGWWPSVESYNFTSFNASDYLYVSTASDLSVAQGFLGEFVNTTHNFTLLTGSSSWQVFDAGAYLMPLFGMSGAWPTGVMPTNAQTLAAIQYADANNLWKATSKFQNWDNRVVGNVTVWGHLSPINPNAEWIWHRKAGGPANPFQPGFNHDEFLVFRVQAVPEPATMAVLGIGLAAMIRRRRAK